MDLKQQLLKEHSRANADYLTAWVGSDKQRFQEMYKIFLSNEVKLTQRAAWIIKNALIANRKWLIEYAPDLVKIVKNGALHTGIIRHILAVFDAIPVHSVLEGQLMEICFEKLVDSKSEIAVKVYSMSILSGLTIKYPEIKGELVAMIELELEKEAPPAIRARAKKILKTLES